MSLKSLLKSKQTQLISHPYARYSTSNKLTCTICGVPIKADALWASHLVSKSHRNNVKKEKEAEEAKVAAQPAKRKHDMDRTDDDDSVSHGKRRKGPADEAGDSEDDAVGSLPADFFSDPSQRPASTSRILDETAESQLSESKGGQDEEDPEWAAFEASLRERDPEDQVAGNGPTISTAAATFSAQPVQYEYGAPVVAQEGEDEDGGPEEDLETAEEKLERERAEQDRIEKEEMMNRIEEEEREQAEADEKVEVLKKRLALIRKRKGNATAGSTSLKNL